jgi:Leukotriene A4 hydrolase, C-terminal
MFPVEWLAEAHFHQVVFLERLLGYSSLPSSHVSYLGQLYGLSTSSNAEIRLRFYELALLDPTSEAAKTFAPLASKWVVGEDETGIIKGRMKFCRPIFRSVFKVDGLLAIGAFTRFKDQFHPIARKMIEKVRLSKFSCPGCVIFNNLETLVGSWYRWKFSFNRMNTRMLYLDSGATDFDVSKVPWSDLSLEENVCAT